MVIKALRAKGLGGKMEAAHALWLAYFGVASY